MLPTGASNKIEYTVLDSRTTDYPITNNFNLTTLSPTSVISIFKLDQLTYIKDYNFYTAGYVSITARQVENDLIEIYEYENTDGSFVAPTPSKLGLFPKYYPELTIDDTVLASRANNYWPV